MARWVPDSKKIGETELLGRRLFPRPSLAGATDQRPVPSFDLRDFEDTREGGEVSLDRLGRSNAETQVLRYLTPRAEAAVASLKPKRIFNGWACIQAKILLQNKKLPLNLIPSPIASVTNEPNEDDLTANPYHAHTRPRGEYDSYYLSLHLRQQFDSHGRFEYSPNDPQRPSRLRVFLQRISKAISRFSERV